MTTQKTLTDIVMERFNETKSWREDADIVESLAEALEKAEAELDKIAYGERRTWDTTPLYEPYTGVEASRIALKALADLKKLKESYANTKDA